MSKMHTLFQKMCMLQPFPAFQYPFLAISWQEIAIRAGNNIFNDPKILKPTYPISGEAPCQECVKMCKKICALDPFPAFQFQFLAISW